MASCGGGRAHDGICGALYAAMTMAGDEKGEQLRLDFIAKHGAYQCKVLKGEGKVPCETCVRSSAELFAALS